MKWCICTWTFYIYIYMYICIGSSNTLWFSKPSMPGAQNALGMSRHMPRHAKAYLGRGIDGRKKSNQSKRGDPIYVCMKPLILFIVYYSIVCMYHVCIHIDRVFCLSVAYWLPIHQPQTSQHQSQIIIATKKRNLSCSWTICHGVWSSLVHTCQGPGWCELDDSM